MYKKNFNRINLVIVIIFLSLLLGSCGNPKKNKLLETARSAYASAEANPQIAKSSPVELKKAVDTLNQAVDLWEDREKKYEIEHYAYLAKKHVEIAHEVAKLNLAEGKVNEAGKTRNKVVLELRTREAEYARSHAALLATQLLQLQAKQTLRGLMITLGDVLFDTGRSKIRSGALRTIERLADFLREHTNRDILIEGFTDNTGSEISNRRLSEKRARSIRNALSQLGIEPNRIKIRGYGQSFPISSNETSAGRQRNRRVEIIISDENGKIPARTS
jgi:outer membrane protein OmpA-like peptidoglycan-associated protein